MGWIAAGVVLAFVAYHARDIGIKVEDMRKRKRGNDGHKDDGDGAGNPAVPTGPKPSRGAAAVLDRPKTDEA